MEYHAHIYWQNQQQRQTARDLRVRLSVLGCLVGSEHNKPIGPHRYPMYQAVYNSDNQTAVEQYLQENRGDLSILLHESINDDVRDHTEGATWLGRPLELDLIWLDRYTRGIV